MKVRNKYVNTEYSLTLDQTQNHFMPITVIQNGPPYLYTRRQVINFVTSLHEQPVAKREEIDAITSSMCFGNTSHPEASQDVMGFCNCQAWCEECLRTLLG